MGVRVDWGHGNPKKTWGQSDCAGKNACLNEGFVIMLNNYTDLELRVREFARKATKEEGASMVEYGLLVALIAIVAIVAVRVLGTSVSTTFSEAATNL